MLFSALTALLAVLPALPVFAGQVPNVDGVFGGVRSQASRAPQVHSDAKIPTKSQPTPGKLRVTENSGVCETTPGVYQASGYADLTSDESLWFWFFEARHNPDTAPLAVWFNGGPGSSSMIGLFQEHGPCRINNDSQSVSLNPNSWNEVANIIYIDQPVGVGFSYGSTTVGTSLEAAEDIWTFFQIWLSDSRFSKYQGRDFAIWTESYGGHYGPTFAAYFLEQNAGIANGTVSGIPIPLKFLGVGDGITDPLIQYPQYVNYAANNQYHPLVSNAVIQRANNSLYSSNGCEALIQQCYDKGTNSVCSQAQSNCNNDILSPLAGNWDVYYVLTQNPDPYPPELDDYLGSSSLRAKIGAQATWSETSDAVYDNFAATGDWMHNSRPNLETVINSGVRVLVYDGDADYILNFMGVEAMVNALETKYSAQYQAAEFANYTVKGQPAGIFKNAGLFSYVRIFGAGHEVPAYKYGNLTTGEHALQFFSQIMSNQSLFST